MSDADTALETLLVGIDAGCHPILDRLFDEGRLPNLQRVFDEGVDGPLTSQIPPWTASAWPSLYTGTNPGKHGVYGFLDYDGYDWDVVNATHVREHALWELLDQHDETSVVVNVPVTAPPPSFDGALVPGYTAPESPDCHPAGTLAELEESLGEYRVYPDRDAEKPAEYQRLVELRGGAFRHLADQFDPTFGFVQFQVTDSVFHEHPDDFDMVRAVYEAVDEEVGRLLDRCDPDTIVVASDHGMGQYDEYEFRVNEFLDDEGLVETTRSGRGMPAWSGIREDQLRQGVDRDNTSASALERTVAAASTVGLTTERVGTVLERLGLMQYVEPHIPSSVVSAGSEQVDFPRSTAYMRSRIELGVRINLAGREPDGTVSPEEYESVRSELIAALESVETPDGAPVFEDVAPREEYYHGPYTEDAADIVTVPAGFDQFLSADLKGDQFGRPVEPWNHKLDGVVAMAGDAVDGEADLDGAHLFDVAPTVLASMGLPVSDRMDGEVLAPIRPAGEHSYPDYDPQPTRATDDRAVETRLADLGYMEGAR